MLNQIVFASKNKGKIREVKQLFSNIDVKIIPVPEDFDVIEDGSTFLENAIIKATAAAKLTNTVSLADDSGLMVDVLNCAPGIHSSRYAQTDCDKINKLLKALEYIPEAKRSARFTCLMALVSPDEGLLHHTTGICEGIIIDEPRGSDGFGFDPVFFIPEIGMTMAEIPLERKNKLSHRAKALTQMLEWIHKNK